MTSIREDPIGVETRHVTLGEGVVAVDVWGTADGAPVLLLHGIPGWRGIWRGVAERLAAGRCVWAPDLLGFGESSDPPDDAHAAFQAAMVVSLIREMGGRPVHLVGFDFGGPVAVLVYRQAPELVLSLVLAATNVFVDTPVPGPLQIVRPPVVGDLFARMLFGRSGLSMMWFAAVARRDRFGFGRYAEMLRFPRGIRWTRRIFQASLRDLPGLYTPVQSTLGTIQVPAVALWGDRDPFFPVAVGRRTAAHMPRASFATLAGCGHFLPAEDPDGFAAAVGALVARAEQRSGAA